jgi:hypothetical protein
MRRIIILASVLLLSVVASDTFAQTSNKWRCQLGYNISAPLGSLKNDYVKNTSFRGATGELSYTINPKFSLGLHSGYQDYYQKYDRQVYHTAPNEDISAVVSNSMEIVPIMLRGTFSPVGDNASAIKPFVTLGAGVNMVNYRQYLGEFPGSDASGNFAAQVGAGIMVPFSKDKTETGFRLGATYNYGAYDKNDISNLNSVGVNAGVVFALK